MSTTTPTTKIKIAPWGAYARKLAAGNPYTPAEVMCQLAHDPLYSVRVRLAQNYYAPTDALVILASDEEVLIRRFVADHSKAPAEALVILSQDEDLDVRRKVAQNPNTPVETLESLTGDEWWVGHYAQQTIDSHYEREYESWREFQDYCLGFKF